MTTFDLDQMQQRWQAQDAKLDQVLTLNQRMLGALERDQVRGSLDGVFRMLWIQFGIDAFAVFLLGVFLGNRVGVFSEELRFVLPAALLMVGAIAVFASVIRQLIALYAIDPTRPVSDVQQAVAALHAHRSFVAKAVILIAPVLWIPLTIVGLQALFGFDTYAWVPTYVLVINLVVCALFIPAVLWAARVYGERVLQYPWARRLNDDLAGRSLADARDRLAELKAFRREA